MKTAQKGFTLVEIAIVLVIIGLLLGGILKGQEMITQAKIKNVIADMSGVSAAMYGYQDRYRALPGDDKGGNRWSSGLPGDGDGIIEAKYLATTGEASEFWRHLRLSGFVAGTGPDQPFNAVSGKMGVQTGNATDNTGVLAFAGDATATPPIPPSPAITTLIMCSANLPDKIAVSVDAQMDDGVGYSGSVRGFKQTAPNPTDIAAASVAYTEDGVSTYTLCRQM